MISKLLIIIICGAILVAASAFAYFSKVSSQKALQKTVFIASSILYITIYLFVSLVWYFEISSLGWVLRYSWLIFIIAIIPLLVVNNRNSL